MSLRTSLGATFCQSFNFGLLATLTATLQDKFEAYYRSPGINDFYPGIFDFSNLVSYRYNQGVFTTLIEKHSLLGNLHFHLKGSPLCKILGEIVIRRFAGPLLGSLVFERSDH